MTAGYQRDNVPGFQELENNCYKSRVAGKVRVRAIVKGTLHVRRGFKDEVFTAILSCPLKVAMI